MRVVFDVSYIQRRRAGIGRYSTELLQAILDADSQIEYLLFGWSFSLDTSKITSLARPTANVRIAQIPGAVRRYYWSRMTWPPVRAIVGRYDIFHSADPLLPPLGDGRGIITVYDLAYRRFPRMFEQYVLKLDRYIRPTLRRASAIIVPSEFSRTDLLNLEPIDEGSVHVIHPPVMSRARGDTAADREVLGRFGLHAPFILSVGTIEPRKNHANLLRAFEIVGAKEPDLHFVLAGKLGWHYTEVLETIKRSPLAARIHHLEYVSDRELDALYRSALCVVYPSLYEGVGLPVLEAMAAGTPVVTSDSSAMKEVGEGAALLVNPGDPEDIGTGIMSVIQDGELARDLSRRGKERASQFSAPAAAKKVIDLYRSLS